jgi:hypothetical protein
MLYRFIVIDEPTKKQQQKMETIKGILSAFYDGVEKKKRTWIDLKRLSNTSTASLSNYLRELIYQGVVKGCLQVDKPVKNKYKRPEIVFEYTEKEFKIEGKPRKEEAGIQIVHSGRDKEGKEITGKDFKIEKIKHGRFVRKRVKGGYVKEYFFES